MNKTLIAKLLSGSTFALALAACGGSGDTPPQPTTPSPPPPPESKLVEPGDVVVVTATNLLVTFNRETPGTVRTSLVITGLQAGETLHGVDFRPVDGLLYGVGSTGRIYEINVRTSLATAKATLSADAADLTEPYAGLSGTSFGVDFNPAADRLRVVSNTGQSLRINVATGATTTDGAINGGAANSAVTASAYTNSFAGTGSTTLFAIDSANSTLYTQNPPNNGTLSVPVTLGVAASSANGFDIDARTNMGYAIFTVGTARNLYTINLGATAGAATLVGAVGINEDIRGMAVRAASAPVAFGLTDDNRLVSFKPLTPNTVDTSVAISGLNAGETLLGIDFRPKDGLMYGLSSTGRIVTVNTETGAATVKASLAADAADLTLPFTAIAGTAFAVDFNPVADRLRVISNLGQSLRINPDTGATTTDGSINRLGATPVVTAAAYTNSIAGATTTSLFDIDSNSDNLALQSPPNDGTLANIGALGVAVEGDVGFDIAGGANGLVLAALRATAAGPTSIYRVDLVTGAATLVNGAATPALSVYGTGAVGLRDIAISIKQAP